MSENQDRKCSKMLFGAISVNYNLKSSYNYPTIVGTIKRNKRFQSTAVRWGKQLKKKQFKKKKMQDESSKWRGKIISQ